MTDLTSNRPPSDNDNPLLLREQMTQMVNGFQISAAIGVVARLGVADLLADGALDPAELAGRVDADPGSLARVMRALARAGVFSETEGRFALTPLGQLLRSDVPGSMRRAADLWTQEWHWRPYGYLAEAVRTGKDAMEPAHGCSYWEYLARDPQAAATFNEIMSFGSSLRASALVQAYDFSAVRRLVDVGGGQGALVCAALRANPELHAIIFDLPGVVDGARALLEQSGLSGRAELVAGDFMQGVPSGGDLYVLSWVLHDWDDEQALRILRNCRKAMKHHARLLLIEMLLPSPGQPEAQSSNAERLAQALDLEMLTVVGGRERTATEYGELLSAAGLRLERTSELAPLFGLLEARPD